MDIVHSPCNCVSSRRPPVSSHIPNTRWQVNWPLQILPHCKWQKNPRVNEFVRKNNSCPRRGAMELLDSESAKDLIGNITSYCFIISNQESKVMSWSLRLEIRTSFTKRTVMNQWLSIFEEAKRSLYIKWYIYILYLYIYLILSWLLSAETRLPGDHDSPTWIRISAQAQQNKYTVHL